MKELKAEIRKKILASMRKGKIEERDGVCRFSEKIGSIPRGTVVINKRVIYGYPKIRRIFSLMEGAKKNLNEGEIWAEEKIDGFNLRVVHESGRIYCISRGGFLDFFATEKISDDENVAKFFRERPGDVLYMEMVGNTPYTAPTRKYDVKYFVFDIGNGKGRFMGPEQRRKICREFGLECVPLLGKFSKKEIKKLRRIAISVDKRGKEGIVMKQHLPRKVAKYVVPSSDIQDLEENSHMVFDMPAGFMKQRVMRSALSVLELKLSKKKYDKKLGEALHKNLYSALKAGGEVSEKFEVLVKKKATWDKVLEHMSGEVMVKVDSEKKDRGGLRIKFRKIYKKGSRKLRRAVEGYAQAD
ncbi:RNA ligase [Candidatus Micrarchaeota archaeon]|nr:RNA ligase [Candidatus Micrarchaeota archaeon]MBD3418195.1 RNA ligase [Candidatus Micrarchaeota archaeon]